MVSSLLAFCVGACDEPGSDTATLTTLPTEPAVGEVEAGEDAPTLLKPWAPPTMHSRTVEVEGTNRSYVLSLPAGARQREGLPVIFAFHGLSEEAVTMQRHTNLDAADAIVVYMQGVDKAWSPAPYAKTTADQDLAYVDAVRAQLIGEFDIDQSRVFAAGFSNGGGFAAFLGCRRPQDFTAVATVAAAQYEKVFEGCSSIPMKQIDFHGTDDEVIQYNGGFRHGSSYDSIEESTDGAAARNRCAAEPEETKVLDTVVEERWVDCDAGLEHYRIEGGHHVWPGGETDRSGIPKDFATHRLLEFFGIGLR